jgi:hypothetical protein
MLAHCRGQMHAATRASSSFGRAKQAKGNCPIFYKVMWDHADKALIPSIFHHDFTFRGSLWAGASRS